MEPGDDYYWVHVDATMGGFVIDSENNLIGVSRVCTIHGNVIPATDAQTRRFETIAKTMQAPQSSRVQQPEKSSSVLRAPAMPKSMPKKKVVEEEEEPEIVDSDSAEALTASDNE